MPPAASEREAPKQPIAASNGSFSQSVKIEVPAFRGLEPNLSLSYDSSRGVRYESGRSDQWLGVGWELEGLSVIERVSPGRGTPRFDSTDIYVLDHRELVACSAATGTSASCSATGGTHTTRVESYEKIRHVSGPPDEWYVWARDGTKYTYRQLGTDTRRWYLSEARDTHNNTVTYTYWCNASKHCISTLIAYRTAGTSIDYARIQLYIETRPESLSYASAGALGLANYRIKTIAVKAGTGLALVRAYGLTYEESPSTGLSRLIRIRQHASIDANNTATGEALPPVELTYFNSTQGFSPTNWISGEGRGGGLVGDFNGDGRSDLIEYGVDTKRYDTHDGGFHDVCRIRLLTVRTSTGSSFQRHPLENIEYEGHEYGCAISGPVVGDFNGDGKADVVVFETHSPQPIDPGQTCGSGVSLTIRARVYLNILAAIPTATSWGNVGSASFRDGCPNWDDVSARLQGPAGDVDGDGKTDIVVAGDGGGTSVRRSGASVFETVAGGANAGPAQRMEFGDFNGDGVSDAIIGKKESTNNTFKVFLSKRTSFGATQDFDLSISDLEDNKWSWALGDFNADARTDIAVAKQVDDDNYHVRIYLSTGSSFALQASPVSVPGEAGTSLDNQDHAFKAVGDLDGDGRSDVVVRDHDIGAPDFPRTLLSRGTTFVAANWTDALKVSLSGDFNGDGRTDLEARNAAQANQDGIFIALARGDSPDLLRTVKNVHGGVTTVDYAPSSQWNNTLLPFVVQTVTSTTVDDGRGTVATTVFNYGNGTWDFAERRFLGFRYVNVGLPCVGTVCPTASAAFRQDYAIAGALETLRFFKGPGQTELRRYTQTYDVRSPTLLPYRGTNTATEVTDFVGSTSKSTYVERTFNDHGAITSIVRHGVEGLTGDEVTSHIDYCSNVTTGYIVDRPSREWHVDGAGTTLASTYRGYDEKAWNACDISKGDETQTIRWRNQPQPTGYVTINTDYSAAGNVIYKYDEVNNCTRFFYDPTFNLFPIETRYPPYCNGEANGDRFKVLTTWDTTCGKELTITDFNQKVTERQYDEFCRIARENRPGSDWTITGYHNLGNPTTQYIRERSSPANEDNPVVVLRYLDGLGRTWVADRSSPNLNYYVRRRTDYNARGQKQRESAPHFSNTPFANIAWTTYEYDALDRLTRTVNPDSTDIEISYGLTTLNAALNGQPRVGFDWVQTIDELGIARREYRDAWGRPLQIAEDYGGSDPLTQNQATRLAWDPLGRLIRVADHPGNLWKYTWDSLDRRTEVDDPDLGIWSYVYDNKGRLTDQTDAEGQLTKLAYDRMDRVRSKVADQGGPKQETTSYDYDETGGFHGAAANVGRLTTSSKAGVKIRQRWDGLGRVVAEQWEVSGATGSPYTQTTELMPNGLVTSRSYPDGDRIPAGTNEYVYNVGGSLKRLRGLISDIDYNARGQVELVTYANGVTADYTYNEARGWVTRINVRKSGALVMDLTYARNDKGQIAGVTSAGKPTENWIYAVACPRAGEA